MPGGRPQPPHGEAAGRKRASNGLLPDGRVDILAVNLFDFGQRWRFGFIRNRDLPRSRHNAYKPTQRKHLLATSVAVTWPLEPPFHDQPFDILAEIVRERRR